MEINITEGKQAEQKKRFVHKARLIWKKAYDYKETNYVGKSVIIQVYCNTCKKEFPVVPSNHIRKKNPTGCQLCKEILRKKKAQKVFIKRATEIWENAYDYSKVIYEATNKKVIIYCNTCKVDRRITPSNHTRKDSPSGCIDCGRKRQIEKAMKPFAQFLKDARRVHKDKYQYVESTYNGAKPNMTIICPKPKHGEFLQAPDPHINRAHGCPNCKKVDEAKLILEASLKGLKYIGEGKDNYYKVYQFIACKHIQEMQSTNVRNSEVNCETCKIEVYEKAAKKKNLTFLGAGRSNDYKHYKFDSCGHKRDIRPTSVNNCTPICFECLEATNVESAERLDLKIIGKSSDGDKNKTRYEFNSCGHQEDIHRSTVRQGYGRCTICYDDRFLNEADEAGLILIGLGKNGNYRNYKFKNCEHEIQLIHVRQKSFICNSCTETSRDLPSNVYLLEISVGDKSWLKLGFAKDVQFRASSYGLPSSAEIDILKIIPFGSGIAAHEFENSLKAKYLEFRLSPDEMRGYHRTSGHTECFSTEVLIRLQEELS